MKSWSEPIFHPTPKQFTRKLALKKLVEDKFKSLSSHSWSNNFGPEEDRVWQWSRRRALTRPVAMASMNFAISTYTHILVMLEGT